MSTDNAIVSLKHVLDAACWPCCEGCKYAEMDGCAKGIEASDASVYLEDGWLRCALREGRPGGVV